MDDHTKSLNNMCRVCTGRAQTSRDIAYKKSALFAHIYMDGILILFGIDISTDIEHVHPQKICKVCAEMIRNSKKTGVNGEMNLSGKYAEMKEKYGTKSIWIAHNEDSCKVCEAYKEQSRPGLRPKTNKVGKQKSKGEELMFDREKGDIFGYLFNDVPDQKLINCKLVLPQYKKDKFTCGICENIFALRTVSTGCHYFCASCLSDAFIANNKNQVSCPRCERIMDYKSVQATDRQFRDILMDVEVECYHCSTAGDYSAFLNYTCKKKKRKKNCLLSI